MIWRFRPLIRGFFFMLSEMIDNSVDEAGFRPLIRGFFFYEVIPAIRKTGMYMTVSVPSFGDSFFMVDVNKLRGVIAERFPSPHSGILFLLPELPVYYQGHNQFPSPHSGILFL